MKNKHLLKLFNEGFIKLNFRHIFLFILFLTPSFYSCEEEFPPEDLTTEMQIIPNISASYNMVNLFWSEYDGPAFDRYEIYYKQSDLKDYSLYTAIKIVKQTFTTIYGLIPSTRYSIYVKAINSNGEEYPTRQVTITTLSDVPSPTLVFPPANTTYYSSEISWSSYKDDNVVDFDRYEIFCANNPGFLPGKENLVETIKHNTDTILTINIFKENTDYYYKVRTINSLGKYSESGAEHIKTAYKPPDTVFLFDPVQVNESYAIIKWTKVKTQNSPYYSIYIGEVPDFKKSKKYYSFQAGRDTVFKIMDLIKYGEYFVWLEVEDNRRLKSLSNMNDFTLTNGGMPVPVTLSLDSKTRNSVILQWTQSVSNFIPRGPDARENLPYAILMSLNPNINPVSMQGYGQTLSTSYQINNLKPNTTYYFRIMFTNRFGKSSYSNEINVTTLS